MRFPKEFYYTLKNEGVVYSYDPEGQVDVNEMIKARPYWKKPKCGEQLEKKILVIAAWNATHWLFRKKDRVNKLLNELIDEGFSLYLWNKEEFVPLAKNSVFDLPFILLSAECWSVFPDEIKAVAQSKFREQQVHVLDEYWLQFLQHEGNKPFAYSLLVSEFNNSYYPEKVLRIIQKAKFPPDLIINNEFSEHARSVFLGLGAVFPTTKVINNYDYLNLKQGWDESLLTTGSIIDNEAMFTLDDLRQINRFKVCFALPANRLQKLLGYIEKLVLLDLSYCTSLTEDFTQGLDLSSLNVLKLTDSTITTPVLVQLLAKAPNLRFLNLVNCRNLQGDFPDLDLSSLEFLLVSNSSLSSQNLNKVLATASQVKVLQISQCVNIQEDFTDGLDLSSLLCLLAPNSLLPGAVYEKLAVKAPKIKQLNLISAKNLVDNLTQDLNLEFLEALDLSNTDISKGNVKKIVGKARKLNLINLAYNHLDAHFIADLDLSSLKTLYLANAFISNFLFEKLLLKTVGLKKLSVSNYGDLPEHFGAFINLASLERLIVSGAYTGENLRRLIALMPRLKVLELINIKDGLDDFSENLDFSSLEELYLGTYSVWSPGVKKLLAKAKNLQVLHIEKCLKLPPDLLTGLILPVFEKLIIKQCGVELLFLTNLCRSMPHIKELDIDGRSLSLINIPNFAALIPNVIVRGALNHWQTQFSTSTRITIPVHNPQSAINHKPPADDFQFHFKGGKKSLDQNMVIEKLSQYWTLTNQHKTLIAQIQNGICNALSHLFLALPISQWLTEIANWDGSEDSLYQKQEVLVPIFNGLTKYVYQYQLDLTSQAEQTYLGDNLEEFLNTGPASMILYNPWHAIAVLYSPSAQKWLFYDPNFAKGVIPCAREQLILLIHRSVGCLISVLGNYSLPTPSIKDPSAFIREGGLLLMCGTEDYQRSLLSQLPSPGDIASDALSGLLLRTTRGVPAWVFAMNEPLGSFYTLELLSRFIASYPQDYKSQLALSLSSLSATERIKYLSCWQSLPVDAGNLIRIITQVFTSVDFDKALQTWQKQKSTVASVALYVQQVVQSGPKKQLLELESTEGVQAMQLLLEKYSRSVSRPLFYVDSPDDLACSAPFMSNENGLGVVHPGPGGRFYDFLMAHHAPLIVVNYDNFEADDVVRFNQLLDEQPRADGTPIPQAAQIIGLINPKKATAYQGADFYSRFDKVATSLFRCAQLTQEIERLPLHTSEGEQKVTVINLYQALDWKERLLGKWVIQKDRFIFVEGALIRALNTGIPLAIYNGLWDVPEFVQFWRHACSRGYIDYEGRRLLIPSTLQLQKHEGYDWAKLARQVSFVAPLNALVPMNPGLLSTFFQEYECDNIGKTLETLPGLIARNANKCIEIQITRSIDEHQWAMVLDACCQYNVHLRGSCAPSVSLPIALQHILPAPTEPLFDLWDSSLGDAPTLILESSDPDVTIASLTKNERDLQIIDVSECSGSDLLLQLQSTQNKKSLRYEFNQSAAALLNALANKQKVLLKGHFSVELCDALAPLLLQRKAATQNAGQLILVSENTVHFDYLPRKKHQVNAYNKQEILAITYTQDEIKVLDAHLLAKEGLSQLKARLTYKRINQHVTDTADAWQGLYHLPGKIRFADFNVEHSADIAMAFNQQRLGQVNRVLAYSPYVFLSGLTGVGKSTFVVKNLNSTTSTLYQSEAKLLDWVLDQSDKRKILFIDEANLSPRQWSEFEGLFNDLPGILINGTYYPLSSNHKVVFAGNPVNYGDERRLAPFFVRHGQALVFEPMPLEFIYEDILKPVFAHSALAEDALMICQPALEVYRYICERSEEQILISPRELQMMVLQVVSYVHQQQPTAAESSIAAQHYAYQFAKDLVPQCYRAEFDSRFKPEIALPMKVGAPAAVKNSSYLSTPSRACLTQQLHDLLALSQFKKVHALNEAQCYGGLGGMVIEGEPGIGKSELVTAVLRANGYEEVHDYFSYPTKKVPEKPFYRMPVSMQTEDKKRLLLTAFHEGAIVVVDEINSSPMMERFLNDLLMGMTPQGERPRIPGFVVIGTQNPVTMAGRRAPSTALARRLTTVSMSAYSHQEMITILIAKGIDTEKADLLVAAYENNVRKARQEHLSPEPTFRDLLKLAKQVIRQQQEAEITNELENVSPDSPGVQSAGTKRQRKPLKKTEIRRKRVCLVEEEKPARAEENTPTVFSKRKRGKANNISEPKKKQAHAEFFTESKQKHHQAGGEEEKRHDVSSVRDSFFATQKEGERRDILKPDASAGRRSN